MEPNETAPKQRMRHVLRLEGEAMRLVGMFARGPYTAILCDPEGMTVVAGDVRLQEPEPDGEDFGPNVVLFAAASRRFKGI
jgi:uncharacterized protein YaiE (UPF0345 family)